jgi:hypothetical protein
MLIIVFFVFQNRNELYDAVGILNNHFSRFGLKMPLGPSASRSKSEEMFFAASLKEAKMQTELSEDLMLHDSSRIHFTNSFKYLGLIITLLLNKDSKIEVRKKAKSLKGCTKYFFTNKDVDVTSNNKCTHLAP